MSEFTVNILLLNWNEFPSRRNGHVPHRRSAHLVTENILLWDLSWKSDLHSGPLRFFDCRLLLIKVYFSMTFPISSSVFNRSLSWRTIGVQYPQRYSWHFYRVLSCVYPIVSCVYPIVSCIRFSVFYRVLRLSGLSLIVFCVYQVFRLSYRVSSETIGIII